MRTISPAVASFLQQNTSTVLWCKLTFKMVKNIATLAELEQEFKNAGDKLVVIDFFATWCGPCKVIAPKIEEMAKEFTDVVFLKVDVDENEETSEKYQIQAMPTFLYFKKGEKIDSLTGASETKFRDLVVKNK